MGANPSQISRERRIWRSYKNGCAVALVKIGSEHYEFMLDTGSPQTYISHEIRSDQNLASVGRACATGLSGKLACFDTCRADLVVLGKAFPAATLLVADVAVLGRDVLKEFVLIFDGPHGRWCEGGSSSV